jgi:hypothetical protein
MPTPGELAALFGGGEPAIPGDLSQAMSDVNSNITRLLAKNSQSQQPSLFDMGTAMLMSSAYGAQAPQMPYTKFLQDDQDQELQRVTGQAQLVNSAFQMHLNAAKAKSAGNPLANLYAKSMEHMAVTDPDRAMKVYNWLAASPESFTPDLMTQAMEANPPTRDPNEAPVTQGGMQWDPVTQRWEEIPGYLDLEAKRAAMTRAPQEAKPMGVLNMRYPDGTMRAFDSRDHKGITGAMQAGAIEVGLSVQSESAAGLFTPPGVGATEKAQDKVYGSQDALAELDNALTVLKTPAAQWATGPRGWFTSKIGGVAELAGIEGVPGGPKFGDIQQVRTVLQGVIGRAIPAITQDDSGRYTEGDMQRVQAAARATEPTAGMPEIEAALKELRAIEERAMIRGRIRLNGLDPSSDDAIALYANELIKRNPGMDKAAAMQRAITESGAINAR